MSWEETDGRRFKHLFLDAEGTLYVPRDGRLAWQFWADPSPERACAFFKLDEGVADVLPALRESVESMCIVSKNTMPILGALLDNFGIREYFDDILLNGDKGRQIASYLRRDGLDFREAVMVGDTPRLDLFPVRRMGIESILVDRPYNRWARAERIRSIEDLPSWLRLASIVDGCQSHLFHPTLEMFADGPARAVMNWRSAAKPIR